MGNFISKTYLVGGHSFSITILDDDRLWKRITQYAPFETGQPNDQPIFQIEVTAKAYPLSLDCISYIGSSDDNGSTIGVVNGQQDGYVFVMKPFPDSPNCILQINTDYNSATVYLNGTDTERLMGFNKCVMVAYAFATAPFSTLLIHSSVVINKGKGYLFLGKSGTGKSTHSRLWIANIEGSELLNDDNPVIRIIDGQAVVFGTPWSGKTPCYRNESAPIGAIVRLSQDSNNQMSQPDILQAYAMILPSCFNLRWERIIADAIHATICNLVAVSPVFRLKCLPDNQAARICAISVLL